MKWLRDAVRGIESGRRHREAIANELRMVEAFEAGSVRITGQPGARCFEMGDGALFTIRNEQPRGSTLHHLQAVLPLSTEDAEDFYGWTRTPEWEASFTARLARGEVPIA